MCHGLTVILMRGVAYVFSWSKGMEIRANLDRLEKWTADQPAEVREALRHLVQLSLAAELLSLAPEQLLSVCQQQCEKLKLVCLYSS